MIAVLLALTALFSPTPSGAQAPLRSHALSLLGPARLPAGFSHFPYANPDAPKGGEVALGTVGTFDSFSPHIVRGNAAASTSLIYDTLLRSNADEAEVFYGHIAHTIEIAADGMSVSFELRPEARFHDGTPLTAEDVAWTFTTLMTQGRPHYRQYWADVAAVVVDSPHRVTFRFKHAGNRELPTILGQLEVLPKHWWAGRDFTKPLSEPPLGSGPWRIEHHEFGRSLVLARVPDYWAANLGTARGLANFDRRRTEYFRDPTVAFEAFKVGQIDFRQENIAKNWATAYDFPAARRGLVKKEEFRHRLPTGMQGFVMNTRREVFKDVRVRHALALVFDFEWANANLFYGSYTRSNSYFSNSTLASTGIPQGAELALLEKYRAKLPPALFTEEFRLPVTDGSGNNREELRAALNLLRQAGWTVRDRKLVNPAGQHLRFEILLSNPSFERIALPYVQWLSRLGVEARVRTVDPAQAQRLSDTYDYDMMVDVFGQSESPGNEQRGYWTCHSATLEGGSNSAGVCDPVVDALVEAVINAPDRPALEVATHALDRVLLRGWYVVPHWHSASIRAAYWDRFARVDIPVRSGMVLDAWWIDAASAAATDAARRAGN
ncbi:MAG: ABC transporter substrate-binding protein [Acetobacteraceae bacterium]|nr:ABC transporter substrate-binding protein [Acetobacteraceae bacterium]